MLRRTADRKVTNAVSPNGKVAKIANAFSLPAGISCPDKTAYCESICYAGKLEKLFKGFRENVEYNYNVLKDMPYDLMTEELINMVQEFVTESNRINAPLFFRIHADGDFFNDDYIKAWNTTILAFGNVQFWVYTRVWEAAVALQNRSNCTVYFSADPDNIVTANRLNVDYGIRIAMVADTFAEAKAIMGDIKSVRCPENNKAIPLIDSAGSACAKCGLCIEGRNNVLFSKTKR